MNYLGTKRNGAAFSQRPFTLLFRDKSGLKMRRRSWLFLGGGSGEKEQQGDESFFSPCEVDGRPGCLRTFRGQYFVVLPRQAVA